MDVLLQAVPTTVVGDPFQHWELVNTWALRAAVFCVVNTGLVAPFMFRKLLPDFYDGLPEGKRISIAMDTSQFFVALSSTTLAWNDVLGLGRDAYANPATASYLAASPGLAAAAGILFGYFIVHIVQMLYWGAATRPTMGAYWYITFGHHGISLLCWPLALAGNSFVFYVGWFVFSEASNVPLDIQTILNPMLDSPAIKNKPSGLWMTMSILFVVAFVVTRFIPMVGMFYIFAVSDTSRMGSLERALGTLTVPLPWLLNLYWGIEIVKQALATLGCTGQKKGKKNVE